MHASLLARAGDPERALELLRLACRLDLDNLTGTSAGGLRGHHGRGLAGLTTGFLGLRPSGDVLGLDPHLPEAWDAVELRLPYHGVRLRVGRPRPVGASHRRPGAGSAARAAGTDRHRARRERAAGRAGMEGGAEPNLILRRWQGPPDPEAAGRSADAAAGRTEEARMGCASRA